MYDKGEGGNLRNAKNLVQDMLPKNVMKGYGSVNLERTIAEIMEGLQVSKGLVSFQHSLK